MILYTFLVLIGIISGVSLLTLWRMQISFKEREHYQDSSRESIFKLLQEQQHIQQQQREKFDEYQIKSLQLIQESLQTNINTISKQVTDALNNYATHMGKQIEKLTIETDQRLKEISGQVEKRLSEGFEKTTATFADVLKRLVLIDEAQKKITELSTNVISLQEILNDKRSRGTFGEVQLSALIRNVMPETHFALQHTLSNNTRVDCMLFLPEPSGNIGIDAKFPLENYQRFMDTENTPAQKKLAETQFRQDIKNHIQTIAEKYIIANETTDGAIMFIPAEAIFAEIHAHFPDLVEHAQRLRVWMASPTTLMAILTTSRAVLKDAATRKQIHIIQEHLAGLGKDFARFQERMEALAKHIKLANKDVEDVQISSNKITSRFYKIEKVELDEAEALLE